MTVTIGIDIGMTGAIAAIDSRGTCVIQDLPVVVDLDGRKRIEGRLLIHVMRQMVSPYDGEPTIYMEHVRVQKMPGRRMSHSTETALVMARGAIQAVADVARWRVVLVEPRAWKARYGLKGKDADANAADKARALACELYPGAAHMLSRKMDHNRAEALLIAHYGANARKE